MVNISLSPEPLNEIDENPKRDIIGFGFVEIILNWMKLWLSCMVDLQW